MAIPNVISKTPTQSSSGMSIQSKPNRSRLYSNLCARNFLFVNIFPISLALLEAQANSAVYPVNLSRKLVSDFSNQPGFSLSSSEMNPQQQNPIDPDNPQLPTIKIHHPSSPHHHHHHPSSAATPTPTAGARRKIGVAVDLSDESAYAVRWAVHHYLRPGDAVILLHVSPTSVLFGADWGPLPLSTPTHTPTHLQESDLSRDYSRSSHEDHGNSNNVHKQQQLEDDFDAFTASKAADLAKPLREAQIPYKIHIVKDHDMRERICLEVERLGLSAVIMGSRGFGAVKRGSDGRLGSVSDYCVHHCACPVVVVRYPDDKDAGGNGEGGAVVNVHIEEDEDAEEGNRKGA